MYVTHIGGRRAAFDTPTLDSAHQPYVGQRCVLVGQAATTGSFPRVTIRLLVEPYLELLVSPAFLRMLPDCTEGVTTVGACVYAWRRSRGVSGLKGRLARRADVGSTPTAPAIS